MNTYVPESVRASVPEGRRYATLGTDGFGRSDTRAALRAFFQVNAASIVSQALVLIAGKASPRLSPDMPPRAAVAVPARGVGGAGAD